MITAAIDIARLFLDGYQSSKNHKVVTQRICEAIHRELRLNAELTAEATKIFKKDPNLANALLLRTQTQAFDALSISGMPLYEIFSEPWSVMEYSNFRYRNQFNTISTVGELVERAYHRVRIQQVRSEVDQTKDSRTLGYLKVLVGKAAQATSYQINDS